jgi:hypothetical protein
MSTLDEALAGLSDLKTKLDGAHANDKVTKRTIEAEVFAQALKVADAYREHGGEVIGR